MAHRDIKSEASDILMLSFCVRFADQISTQNILMQSLDPPFIKICDFGTAKLVADDGKFEV